MKKRINEPFRIIVIAVGLIVYCPVAQSQISMTKTADTTVDTQALTIDGAYGKSINGLSFQQDMIVTHLDWQYAVYYNGTRHVCVARRQLPSGNWQTIELTDYYFGSNDAHNIISMGICPNDGTIHLAFDHHAHPLHYRISQPDVVSNPDTVTWDASIFGSTRNYLEVGKSVTGLTYPRFWQTPDGDLQMSYRLDGSGNGDMYLADYNGTTHLWANTRKVISRTGVFTDARDTSTARNPYMNAFTYDAGGRLHATWCWREKTQWANHDILYAYSDDGGITWYNNNVMSGIQFQTDTEDKQTLLQLKFFETGPKKIGFATGDAATEILIGLNSTDLIVVPVSRAYGLMNQQTQAVDPWNRIHTVMWHCTDESYAYAVSQGVEIGETWGPAIARRYHHYWRDTNGKWRHNELPEIAGNRPKLFIQRNGNAFLAYIASQNPIELDSGLFFTNGNLVIQAATAVSGWTDWQVIYTEPGPFVNEVQGDYYRFKQEDILSVHVQHSPAYSGQSTPLRILDLQCSE
jgi:hypothetical protein